jgi:WD40 repeat protein
MTAELTIGIVRLLNPQGETAGTGFVVTDDGLVATCAHVVEAAGSEPGGSVRVAFHATEQEQQANIEPAWWRDPDAEDVVILRLQGLLPEEVVPLPLGSSANAEDHIFSTFGFPAAKSVEGMPGKCKMIGLTTDSGFPVLPLRSNEVTLGFSGAPVWDDTLHTVIGMVVSILAPDPYGKMQETAFVIPVETLRDVCPALALSDFCPYRGLQVFETKHAKYYFGRETATQELLEKLSHHKFVAVVGVSGSGKSSLVRAGLEKGLLTWAVPGLVGRPRCLFPPGSTPLLNLVLALADLPEQTPEGVARSFGLPPEALTEEGEMRRRADGHLNVQPPKALGDALRSHFRSCGLLLIVDQFERLYTECSNRDVQSRFIETLLAAAGDEVKVLLVLRADFYGLALAHADLGGAIKKGQVTLLSMRDEELGRAIAEPARMSRRSFQPGLVDRLIADVGGRAGDLPLLEFALTELWKRDSGKGVLTLASYEGLGYDAPDGRHFPGVQGAIARRAEDVWRDLSEEEKEAARRVFLRLVTPGPVDEQGKRTAEDASRRAWQAELDEPAQEVADQLANARLLTKGKDPVTGQPTVEVAHEALVRAWPRLQGWVTDDYRLFLRWSDRELSPFLRRWLENKEHPDFLLPTAMLEQARSWLKKYPAELSGPPGEYIRESVALQERERAARERRRSLVISISVAVAIVMGILGAVAWNRSQEAQSQARIALSRQLATQALTHLDDRFDLALLLSLEANRVADTLEARGSLLDILEHNPRLVTFLRGHIGEVTDVAFSPDGNLLASSSRYGTITLWEVAGRQSLGPPLTGHIGEVTDAAFSPDGQILASGGQDSTVILWDVATRRPLAPTLKGHSDKIESVAFSPDGQMLASGGQDATIILWDVATHQPLGLPLTGHGRTVSSVAFSRDGKTLASGSHDGTIMLWDVEDREQLDTLLTDRRDEVRSIVFSPDGEMLASGSENGTVILWDVKTRKPLATPLVGHKSGVLGVDFSPDGKVLASGSKDSTIILWDVATYQPLDRNRPLTGHTDWVSSVTFSPDGNTLASGSEDKTIILWDMASHKALAGHNSLVYSVAFSPDGKVLASGSEDKTIILWDVVSREPLGLPLEGHTNEVYSVAFSPDAKTLVSSSCAKKDSGLCIEGEIRLWDVESHRPIDLPLTGHSDSIESVGFSPDGKMLVSASCGKRNGDKCEGGEILLWDVATRQPLAPALAGHSDKAEIVAFSPDGQILASGGQDGIIILWDVATRQRLVPPLKGHSDKIESIAFSPDGQILASGGQDSTVILWDVATRQRLAPPLTGHGGWLLSIAFSPDGKMLASGSTDNTIILWDMATHRTIGSPLTGHDAWVYSVTFSPDGNQLASSSGDHTITLRDVNFELWKDRACQTANRSLSWLEWKQYLGNLEGFLYQVTCPKALVYPADAFEQAKAFALAEGTEQSLTILLQAVQMAIETDDAVLNNYVCWNGSIDGFAESVMPACERAVELDSDNGGYRDSRGLARALVGAFEGAIEDFQFYIEWGQQQNRRSEERLQKRQGWIEQLKTGQSPFDEALLKELRQE